MRLSVIVCTRNRAYAISGCLDSIAESLSAAAPVEAEIVVVDNASDDDTSAVARKWAGTCAFPVQVLHEPKKGVSAARNCGLRAARGALLAFTDDDCRMDKDHLAAALRHDDGDMGLVLRGGRVELGNPDDLPLTIKTGTVPLRWNRQMKSAKRENLGNTLLGCNMTMRRALVDRIGFFDERLGAGSAIPGGEDIDYVFRAYLAGMTIEYAPDMAVVHYHGRKLPADGNKLLRNYALGEGALYAKYLFRQPDFGRQFYWDMKNAVREIAAGRNGFMPDAGFSYKDKVFFCLWGAVKYFFAVLRPAAGK